MDGRLQQRHSLTLGRFDRHRPALLPLPPGDYTLRLSSEGRRRRRDNSLLRIAVPSAPPIVLTCLPAKRRFLTAERLETAWFLDPQPNPAARRAQL